MQGHVATLNSESFRPNSKARKRLTNFILEQGGIGDYICALPALEYVAETQPHVEGRVFTIEPMIEICAEVLKKYPHWQVHNRDSLTLEQFQNQPTFRPSLHPVNATGAHLLDLGFIYFAAMNPPPPEYNRYPILNFSELTDKVSDKAYAVMTPGATTTNRTLKAKAFNGIKDHLIDKGITPVFLGKQQITDVRAIDYEMGYNYDGGVDLREKTTLLQAAGIMSKATLVVGLDNGLLHLAACTDVPILFGYNIASPEHRRPRRAVGKIWEIYPSEKELPCTFCQSKMRFLFGHDFALCVYQDNKCLEFLNDPKKWCDIIDQIVDSEGE